MLAPILLEPRATDITTPAGVTASYVWVMDSATFVDPGWVMVSESSE